MAWAGVAEPEARDGEASTSSTTDAEDSSHQLRGKGLLLSFGASKLCSLILICIALLLHEGHVRSSRFVFVTSHQVSMHALWKTCAHFNAKVGVVSKRGAWHIVHMYADSIAKSEGTGLQTEKKNLLEVEIGNMHSCL